MGADYPHSSQIKQLVRLYARESHVRIEELRLVMLHVSRSCQYESCGL